MEIDIEAVVEQVESSTDDDASKELEEARKNKFDYATAIIYTKKLISENIYGVYKDVEIARKMRNIEVSLETLQAQGKIDSDETIIPMRVIDSNIAREQPAYVSFLTQSRRLAIFECLSDPGKDNGRLEKEFTRGLKYEGWLIPHFKVLDGAQAFGLDFVEVEYNEDKPLHVSLSHVGRENLLYNQEAENFQNCDEVLRRYDLTVHQLMGFVQSHGFNAKVVDMLTDENETDLNKTIKVFKRYFKFDGKIYVSWMTDESSANDWLKAPELLWRGRKSQTTQLVETIDPATGLPIPTPTPVINKEPETKYPYHPFIYRLTEEKALKTAKGRVYLDGPEQDMQTALWSCAVVASERSTRIFGSPEIPDGSGSAIEQTDFKAIPGIYKTPMKWWNLPPPNSAVLETAQKLSIQKQNESGKINFAVNNRVDSRKTAEEIKTANQQQALLSGVQVALYAMFLQSVYTDVWSLVQSMALVGDIKLLTDVNTGQNDTVALGLTYKIVPAGESDVIEKAEELQYLNQVMPIAQQVAPELANKMFQDIIEIMFPEKANIYKQILQRAGDISSLIGGMFHMLEAAMIDPATNTLKPEFAQFGPQIQQLTQQVAKYAPQAVMAMQQQGKQQQQNQQPQQ